ncbi:hypothetical protein [Vibrio parahaemolyticus]|uniref:hypothetical protein n=1 Tax=Vibrio parahaemolyticus TaxID=670 RepID=UPI0005438733|nr:hypothetical protein [Vibrio parahaemolyticus]EHR6473734.1 hypothetical protein [Vibrio parahaemolyticus]ELB2163012.1 hypothetical protein [Vibrio parahaemolyticus]KHF17406.1 hypothetical protein PO81_20600 [Vibrio parahaemolyticus]KYX28217.1 hypothetical protein AVO50_19515 [Vibrio parahaemolyticus]MBE3686882.1 hypothetical protein [Vibrio parahaemolyticus]
MKKLFKLKKWLSIEDCAKRLSFIFEEEVTIKAVIQLCLDDELDICWLFRYGWAEEAAETHSLLGAWFIEQDLIPEKGSMDPISYDINFGSPVAVYGIKAISDPFRIEGLYKLNLKTGVLKDHLMSFLSDRPTNLINLEGCLLIDPCGRFVRPVDFLTPKEGEGVFTKLSERAYPTDNLPELDDLVVLREDIEALEARLSDGPEKSFRTPDATLKQSIGIMAALLSQSNSKYKKGSTANCSQIAKDVELYAARLGIELESASNLNRDISTALKSLQNWQPK